MSYEEKGTWVYLVTSAGAYAVYLAIILGGWRAPRSRTCPTRRCCWWRVRPRAAAALVMAMAKVDYFWIANVIYLGFVLWAVAGSMLKLAAYRRGL